MRWWKCSRTAKKPLPREQVLHPGVDSARRRWTTRIPLAFGFDKQVDVFFENSPGMQLAPDAVLRGREARLVVRLERTPLR